VYLLIALLRKAQLLVPVSHCKKELKLPWRRCTPSTAFGHRKKPRCSASGLSSCCANPPDSPMMKIFSGLAVGLIPLEVAGCTIATLFFG
jgi:hypothetical protein